MNKFHIFIDEGKKYEAAIVNIVQWSAKND